jgi:hypothetical protein
LGSPSRRCDCTWAFTTGDKEKVAHYTATLPKSNHLKFTRNIRSANNVMEGGYLTMVKGAYKVSKV